MSGLSLVVEFTGPRMVAYRAPRETPSRILASRLHRSAGLCHVSPAAGTRLAPAPLAGRASLLLSGHDPLQKPLVQGTARRYSTLKESSPTSSTLSSEDMQFLARLLNLHDHQIPNPVPQDGLKSRPLVSEMMSELSMASVQIQDSLGSVVYPVYPMEKLHQLFRGALQAMQLRDSRKLLKTLNDIAKMPENELVEAIATLPRTTFSEFLRSLDPLQIGRDNDPTHGVSIGPGMWQILNLGAVLDEWGIRVLYTRLLRQMLVLMRALNANSQVLNINDYIPLMQAAGLTSDMTIVKLLWEQMRDHDMAYWRNSTTYHEFIKARFLTDPAYYGYDKKRLMMSPRNLHRRGRVSLKASLSRLDRLRKNLRRSTFKFGLNKNVTHAEDLSRMLRKPLPTSRVFFYTQMSGLRMTEEFLCSFMVAFARAGALRFIRFRILEDYFGITIDKDKNDGKIFVGRTGTKQKTIKDVFRPSKPCLRPTARLIDAVVYSYCSNGQVSMAFNIVDFISNNYKIPISKKVWFELLEWSYILSSPPTSTAWRMAGLGDRVPSRNAIEIIWNTMTSPPYNAQPGFKQYDIYIKTLLALGKLDEALKYMHEARRLYKTECARFEAATFAYAGAKRAGLDFTRELREFQRSRFLRSAMWQRINAWCNVLLEKKFRPADLHDPMATQGIPEIVREWRDVLTNPVQYRTASGFVSLLDPAETVEQTIRVRDHIVDVPMKVKGKWGLKPLIQRQFRLMSKHGVGDLMSTREDPLNIMKGVQPVGYPSQSKRLQRHRAWEAAQEQKAAQAEEHGAPTDTQATPEEYPQSDQDIWDDDDY